MTIEKIEKDERKILEESKTCYDTYLTTYDEKNEDEDKDYYNINSNLYLETDSNNILILQKNLDGTYVVECYNRQYLINILSDPTKGVYGCFVKDDIPDSPTYLENLIDESSLYYRLDTHFGSFYLSKDDIRFMIFSNKKLFYLKPKIGKNNIQENLERTVSRRVFINFMREQEDYPVEENYHMSGSHCQKGSDIKIYTIDVCGGDECLKNIFTDQKEINKKYKQIDDEIMNGKFVVYDDNGKLRRESWYENDLLDRDEKEGPADIFYDNNEKVSTVRYYSQDNIHRLDGPAEIDYDGNIILKEAFKRNGNYYRENDLPHAIEYMDENNKWKESWFYDDEDQPSREGDKPALIVYGPNGKIRTERFRKPNSNISYQKDYYPTEKIRTETWFKDGEEDRSDNLPAVIEYFPNGVKSAERWYNEGNFISEKLYTQDGKEYIESESEDWSDY